MERIVISFNETGYNLKILSIERTAAVLTEEVSNLEEKCELKLTDSQKKRLFLDCKDLQPFLDGIYKDQPLFVRNTIKQQVKKHFDSIFKNNMIYEKNKDLQYITVSKGVFELNPQCIDDLRKGFENAIESERAKKAYELHQSIIESIKELTAMAKERNITTGIMTWFKMDRYLNIEKSDIDYNRI